MTPEQREDARVKAQRIVNAGGTENADYAVAVGFLSLIAQVEALAVPQGWQLVPVEPTIEMIAALGYAGDEVLAVGHGLISKGIADDYAAMLDAAPTIPAKPVTKEQK